MYDPPDGFFSMAKCTNEQSNLTGAARVSAWRPAALNTGGETILAIGDVHGCADQLQRLLTNSATLVGDDRVRVIFLGDLIDRGPENIRTMSLWSADRPLPTAYHVNRLMGNHEQLLQVALGDGRDCQQAYGLWLRLGGNVFLDELRRAAGQPSAGLTVELLRSGIGNQACSYLCGPLLPGIIIGNIVFVHAGIHPRIPVHEFLALPASSIPRDQCHWAWITDEFLSWTGGFEGLMIVHGHVPPSQHHAITGVSDPHTFQCDRLCLDAGSAVTGAVCAALLQDGRYRIVTV